MRREITDVCSSSLTDFSKASSLRAPGRIRGVRLSGVEVDTTTEEVSPSCLVTSLSQRAHILQCIV